MIKRLLESPHVYEFSQFLWYRKGKQNEYATAYANARAGEKILDIGCGVGSIAQYFPDVLYHGVDSNAAYVDYANRKYGVRATFRHGVVGKDASVDTESYDPVMANGLLHQLNEREAKHLLALAHQALKPGGRLVTRDGCFEQGQNRFVRSLPKNDRGQHLRTERSYQQLIREFPTNTLAVRRDMLRLPYSLIVFQCTKQEQSHQCPIMNAW